MNAPSLKSISKTCGEYWSSNSEPPSHSRLRCYCVAIYLPNRS